MTYLFHLRLHPMVVSFFAMTMLVLNLQAAEGVDTSSVLGEVTTFDLSKLELSVPGPDKNYPLHDFVATPDELEVFLPATIRRSVTIPQCEFSVSLPPNRIYVISYEINMKEKVRHTLRTPAGTQILRLEAREPTDKSKNPTLLAVLAWHSITLTFDESDTFSCMVDGKELKYRSRALKRPISELLFQFDVQSGKESSIGMRNLKVSLPR